MRESAVVGIHVLYMDDAFDASAHPLSRAQVDPSVRNAMRSRESLIGSVGIGDEQCLGIEFG